jgi:hypothetical protein
MIELLERVSTIALNHGMKLEEALAIHDRMMERFEENKKKYLEERRKANLGSRKTEPELVAAHCKIEVKIEAVQTKPDMETYRVLAKMNGRWLTFCDVSDRSMAEDTKQQLLRLNESDEVKEWPRTYHDRLDQFRPSPLFDKNQEVAVSILDPAAYPSKPSYLARIDRIGINAGQFYYTVIPDDSEIQTYGAWIPETSIEPCQEVVQPDRES